MRLPPLIVLVSLLAACGRSGTPPEPVNPAADGAAAATAAAPAAAAPATASGVKPQELPNGGAEARNADGVKCNIEYLGDVVLEQARPEVMRSKAAKVSGWYAGTGGPRLYLDGAEGRHWAISTGTPTERPDVAQSLGRPDAGKTGFEVMVDLSALPPGEYGMHLGDATGSAASLCAVGRGFTLR